MVADTPVVSNVWEIIHVIVYRTVTSCVTLSLETPAVRQMAFLW